MTGGMDNLSNYADRQTPQFRVLSERQCQELYLAALECLTRVGVLVNQAEARLLLASAGARVEGNRAFIPPHIIQEALPSVPRTFTLWGRDGAHPIQVANERVYFGPGPTCTYYQDTETGERRKSRRGDAATTARVVDALPNLDYAMSLSLFDDVRPALSPVYEFSDMIANTGKPIVAWANDTATLQDIYRIAAAVAGGLLGIRLVNLGEFLHEGDAIVSLQSLNPIFVNFLLPQQELAKIALGLTVRVTSDALPGEVIEGTITAINPQVDAATRNIRIQATVTNSRERLRPGMFAEVAVVLPGRNEALAVPATSVLYAPYGDSVFVVEDNKTGHTEKPVKVVRQQFARLGEKRGDFVSVVSGVKEGRSRRRTS